MWYILLQLVTGQLANNNQPLWGTYRPNLYFGTRTRTPESFLTGLLWFGTLDTESWKSIDKLIQDMRHTCDQGDDMVYGWKYHNGKDYGLQTIKDPMNNVAIKIEFVSLPSVSNSSSWIARISGEPLDVDLRIFMFM